MDCEVCDKPFYKINDIDMRVKNAEREKDYLLYRKEYLRATSVVQNTKDMLQECMNNPG
jgi:hypothetical protein